LPQSRSRHLLSDYAGCRAASLDESYFDKRAWVAEILGVFGNSIAVMTGVAWVTHKVFYFLLSALFP
jgi:hypothetical protein